jgi:hypothetical protein
MPILLAAPDDPEIAFKLEFKAKRIVFFTRQGTSERTGKPCLPVMGMECPTKAHRRLSAG